MDTIDLKRKSICFIVPPLATSALYSEWDLSLVDSVSPPLGLLSLAAMVRKFGATPHILDAYARKMDIETTIGELVKLNPDYLGVTCMSPSFPNAVKLVKELKRSFPGKPVILGGQHISALPVEVMRELPEVEYGVINEGEITIIELIDALNGNRELAGVKGIIFRAGAEITRTPAREYIQDMDIIPYPAWDLLPSMTETYRLSIIGTKGWKSTSIITSRGCPANCSFCDVGGVGRKIRGFSAGYVIGMIEHLKDHYGITDFLIYDDTFVALKGRLKEICEEIIRRKWKIHWSCCARVDIVNKEMLVLMKRAGCWQIEYGIESGSEKVLALMKKRARLDQVRRALRWTKEAGIETRGNFIFGFLGETRETLEETIRFALELDLDLFQQSFLTPYPGSEIYRYAEEYGKFDKDLEKMSNLRINFIPHGLTERELADSSKYAFRKFYLRPRIILHHFAKLRNLNDLYRLLVAFYSFVKGSFLR